MTFLQKSFGNPNETEADLDRTGADLFQGSDELLPRAIGSAGFPPLYGNDGAAAGSLPHPLPIPPKRFDHVQIEIDPEVATYWCFMKPFGRASFTPELLGDISSVQHAIRLEFARRERAAEQQLKYVVLGSRVPRIFNLGGDLALFSQKIRGGDRAGLQRYALECVQVVYNAAISMDLPVITIALVQGDALGGGFEAALACHLIVAEKSAKFGLPEVLFNLFPGMGAYNFLSRRLDAARAEKIILSGQVYSADEMLAMGIIDMVVEDGCGEEAVRDYIERNARRHNAHQAVYRARQRLNPVTLEELCDVTELWVDAAMRLTETDLRRMERLTAAQERRRASLNPLAVAAE